LYPDTLHWRKLSIPWMETAAAATIAVEAVVGSHATGEEEEVVEVEMATTIAAIITIIEATHRIGQWRNVLTNTMPRIPTLFEVPCECFPAETPHPFVPAIGDHKSRMY
jgi:hypothetical protein